MFAQVGAFPHYGGRWAEWNGHFRDSVRQFIKVREQKSSAGIWGCAKLFSEQRCFVRTALHLFLDSTGFLSRLWLHCEQRKSPFTRLVFPVRILCVLSICRSAGHRWRLGVQVCVGDVRLAGDLSA
jgi:hypothetical protein